MKRKSTLAVIAAVICMVMAVAMILPMTVVAADTPVTGFTFADEYYKSEWVGEKLVSASYGNWVSGDGQFNGAWQWADKSGVEYDPKTGEIKIVKQDPSLMFHPGHLHNNKLEPGAAVITFDIYFDPGMHTLDGNEYPNFPGFSYAYAPGDSNNIIIFVDTEGTVYAQNFPTAQYTPPTVGKMKEGWNTFEFVILPKDADGNVLEDTNNVEPVGSNVATTTIYTRVYHEDDKVESRAYTWDYLNNKGDSKGGFYKINEFAKDAMKGKGFFANGGEGGWCNFTYIKPHRISIGGNPTGGFIRHRGGTAINIGVDHEMINITYKGFPELTQGIPAESSNKELVVPSAIDPATNQPVEIWYDPINNKFLKPGDLVTFEASAQYEVATGQQLAIGKLGAALDNVRPDLSTYTYAELDGKLVEIAAAAEAAGLPEDDTEMERMEGIVGDIEERMEVVAAATEEMITYAAIFSNKFTYLGDRADAYEAAKQYADDMDVTYRTAEEIEMMQDPDFDAENYEFKAEIAKTQLDTFMTDWANAADPYLVYQGILLEIDNIEAGPEKNAKYAELIEAFNKVADAFPDFMLDASVEAGYLENADEMKKKFDELTTIVEMNAFLADWAKDWEGFCNAMYFGSPDEDKVPQALIDAVDHYNETVRALNNEILEAAHMVMVLQQDVVDTSAGNALISDIKSKLDEMYEYAQPEEE